MKLLLFSIFLFCSAGIYSQQCDYFPADCPDNETFQQQAEKKWDGPADLKVKEEYAMQDSLRHFTIAMMQDIAKKKNWECYTFIEDQDNGIGIDGNTKPLPYPLRRPCQWGISFVFIVNKDSLNAWQNWYKTDLQNASNKVVDSYKQSGNEISQDENRKKFLDSANYYGDQKAKYMTDHAADYQKALLSNDSKTQKKYEDEMKRYDDKINAFINKTNDKTTENYSSPGSQFKDLETYRHKNTIAFRNGSIIRVSMNINDYLAYADDDDGNKKIVKQLPIPGSTIALLLHNNSPDEHEIFGQYLRSPDVVVAFFGKWMLKPDQYHSYHSAYFADKKNTDALTVKKIPCDKVQTIVLHVEGSPKYMNQFLQAFDTEKLKNLIVKE
ncbi:MAG: hypothetical protein ACHQF0_02520 [Chitinophagales bacterium]